MAEKLNTLELTDAELTALNTIVRSHKVEITNEDLVLVLMGKRTTPLVGLTLKVAQLFEGRQKEVEAETPKPPTSPDTPQV